MEFHMRSAALVTACALLLAADNPLDGDKFLQKADEKYDQAAKRAQDAYAKALGEALDTRLKTYRGILAAATKAGDFDRATAVKARINELEQAGADTGTPGKKKSKARPTDTVKFGKHEYALIAGPATWHVAKAKCEEMGGHLAIINGAEEADFVKRLCGTRGSWVGATDELEEGDWRWVDGSAVDKAFIGTWFVDNDRDLEHCLTYWAPTSRWEGGVGSSRYPFVCEWDD
jgi:hypothetical protein